MRKLFFVFLSIAALFCVPALPASAALIGTSVTGSLQFNGGSPNFFDPVYGFAPNGYLNSAGTTVTISSSAAEFGYDDGANLLTANFTDNQLTISDVVEAGGLNFPFTMTFTDAALAALSIGTVPGSLPLSYSLGGNVLMIRGTGGSVTSGQAFTETLNLVPAPEPSIVGTLLFSSLIMTAFVLARAKAGSQS